MDAGVERLFYFITANQFISLKLLINVVGRIFPFFSGDCSKSVIYQWFLSFYLSISYANWLNDSKCDKNHKKPASSLVGYSDHEIPSSISMVTRDRKKTIENNYAFRTFQSVLLLFSLLISISFEAIYNKRNPHEFLNRLNCIFMAFCSERVA